MAVIIKIRCNGKEKHINEVDLERAAKRDVIVRSTEPQVEGYPERVVLPCGECTAKVIITRDIFEKYLKESRR